MFCCVQVDGGRDGEGREQFSSIVNSGESPSKCWPNSSSFCPRPPRPPELSEREVVRSKWWNKFWWGSIVVVLEREQVWHSRQTRSRAGAHEVLNQMRQICVATSSSNNIPQTPKLSKLWFHSRNNVWHSFMKQEHKIPDTAWGDNGLNDEG